MSDDEANMVIGTTGAAVVGDELQIADQVAAGAWKGALEHVVPCVVVLKVTQTRSFDTENAGSSYATGFVVDAKRGIILTNRHVVTPGPVVADAVFLNREEIPLKPIYRDPVHDFGFFRFDPAQLKFMELNQIELAPEAAHVGLDVRVVGNDSGEKVSILPGVLARLDRDAPVYGRKTYNDFNCFYFQAASGTKGGSSGSPVVDCNGRAVALNAGGKTKAASAYYLPLEPIVRVLKIIQGSLSLGPNSSSWEGWQAPLIARGDLAVTFIFKSMDEVKRLGLRPETEAEVRAAPAFSHGTASSSLNTGMLVVESVVPGGPSDGLLEAGDVLVKINGAIVTHFLPMEQTFDSHVDSTVHLLIERGGEAHKLDIRVQDLHKASPSTFLEVAGGSLNALSYQQGRNNTSKLGLVQVIDPGYMLGRSAIPKNAIITRLADSPTPDLASFASVLSTLKHGQRVPVEYYCFGDRHRRQQTLLNIDREWYGPPILWTRDDSLGTWHPSPISPMDQCKSINGVVDATDVKKEEEEEAEEEKEEEEEEEEGGKQSEMMAALEKKMEGCLVIVEVEIPLICLVDGVYSKSFAGTGVIVYQSDTLGLVLVDRNTVVVGPSDVILSFAASPCEVTARVCFLHPLHDFSILAYDPQQLPAAARKKVRPVEMDLRPIKRGEEAYLAGVTKALQLMQKKCVVTSSTLALSIPTAQVPRFRAVHEELVRLDTDFGSGFGGLLSNANGEMRALWASYAEPEDESNEREWCAGLAATVFHPWIKRVAEHEELLINGAKPPPLKVTVLDAEVEPLLLSKAAQHKLPQEYVTKLAKVDPERKQVLKVKSTVALSHANEVLKSGDMILACEGKLITKFEDLDNLLDRFDDKLLSNDTDGERAAKRQRLAVEQENGQGKSLTLTVFRSANEEEGGAPAEGGKVMDITVRLGEEEAMGTDRIIHFAGAQLQAPHRWCKEQGHMPDNCGVFISRWHHGSPSHRYGLFALHYITEVNGKCVKNLDEFAQEVKIAKDGEFVRIKMRPLEAPTSKIIAVKLDLHFWPTSETRLDKETGAWTRYPMSMAIQ